MDLFDYSIPPNILRVKVTPRAKFEHIKKEIMTDGTSLYKIYVTAIAEDGKANEAVIKLISKEFNVTKSSITITHGFKTRDKIIQIKR